MNSKFIKELSDLVQNELISKEVALNIENYYKSKQEDSPNRLFTIFGVLGSLLVGLGIILILAHNWDNFSRTIKTVFAFIPLVIGQLIVGYTILKKKSSTWREASGTFLFFAVGACMALVAQIYNIPGDLSSFLLTWTLLCIPLIYLLKSNALALLSIVFTTYYACVYGYSFMSTSKTPWLYLLLFALIIPHYLMLFKERPKANITSIFNWLLPLSLVICLGTFVVSDNQAGFFMYIILFGLFYNIGKISFFETQNLRRNGYLIFGSLGTVILLLSTSFKWFWKGQINDELIVTHDFYIILTLFIIACTVIIYLYSKYRFKGFNLFQYVFIIFGILFFLQFSNASIPTILVNILILTLGLIAIKAGADKFHFGILNYGLLIITALVICRFFDSDISFVIRGLLFVIVGVGFFLTNYIMLKKINK